MLGKVLCDYIQSFRWSNFIEKHRTSDKFIFWWICVYQICIHVVINGEIADTAVGIAVHYLWVVPFLMGTLGIELLPLYLPKLCFLCPMNKSERKQYLGTVLWVRIAVPVCLEAMAGMGLIVIGILKPMVVASYVFSSFSLLFLFSFVSRPALTTDKESDKSWKKTVYFIGFMFATIMHLYNEMLIEQVMKGSKTDVGFLIAEMIIYSIIDILCFCALPKHVAKMAEYEDPKQRKNG